MTQPFFLPTLPTITGKPNILRAGVPVTNGSSVNGVVQPGPAPGYFVGDPLVNIGTTACYQFSNEYCYPNAPAQAAPGLNESIALDLANNQHTCYCGGGVILYGNGGFLFTGSNPTDGTANPASQGILFNPADLVPSDQTDDHYVSTIWVGMPLGSFVGPTVNALVFTYPDGSTWSLVAGVWTFTPVGQVAIAVPADQTVWSASQPLQLGYSITNIAAGQYTIGVYVNGQLSSSVDYTESYPAPAQPVGFVGFGPDSTAAANLYPYTALRFYMEDLTLSGNDPRVVVASDYLMNYTDMVSVMASNGLPATLFTGSNPAQTSVQTPAPTMPGTPPAAAPSADTTAAAFTASVTGRNVVFTDASVPGAGATITGWSWDFGNSLGTSSDQNPTYNYTTSGIFTVTLTVTDSNGQTATFSGNVMAMSS